MFINTEFTNKDIAPDVIRYGDIHGAYIKYFNEMILFNAGSVGNPLDINQASYVIIKKNKQHNDKTLDFIFKRVIYDVDKEIKIAREIKMLKFEEYERELKTAIYINRKE